MADLDQRKAFTDDIPFYNYSSQPAQNLCIRLYKCLDNALLLQNIQASIILPAHAHIVKAMGRALMAGRKTRSNACSLIITSFEIQALKCIMRADFDSDFYWETIARAYS
jgi:hypothetical protein